MMRRVLLIILSILCVQLFAQQQTKEAKAIPGEFLVKIKKGYKSQFLSNLKNPNFISFVKEAKDLKLISSDVFKLTLNDDISGFSGMVDLKALYPEIEVIEPNYIYTISLQEESLMEQLANYSLGKGKGKKDRGNGRKKDMFDQLWGLKNTGENEPKDSRGRSTQTVGVAGADISVEEAWEMLREKQEVKIAVIDTGVDYRHPDLVDNILINKEEIPGNGIDDDGNGYVDDYYGYDFLNDDADPMDDHGHGTHCSGTIAGVHNKFGVKGVAPNAKILPIKFLGPNGGSTEGAIKSIDYAVVRGVDIMSNSWGGGGYSVLLKEAIERANKAGILFVAAAGNHGADNDKVANYPSNYEVENIIAVAAHHYGDELANFSCYGKEKVHIAAPGKNILSTTAKTKYTDRRHYNVWSGTSMATPHVSGALGLLLAHEGKMSVEEAKFRLMETSVKVDSYEDKVSSGGRLDAHRLLLNQRD